MASARVANRLAEVCRRIASGADAATEGAVADIATRRGWAVKLARASLAALCAPLSDPAVLLASAAPASPRAEVIGFVMPGNIPGAGLHELIMALLAGRGAIVKSAVDEPVFFAHFANFVRAQDEALGARIFVATWSRKHTELTRALREHCDRLAAFGDDATIARLGELSGSADPAQFAGFANRVSGALVSKCSATNDVARRIARDVSFFEQRGCLSPHHIFVEDTDGGAASAFATRLARALSQETRDALPPPTALPFDDAAAIRRMREQARWRAIAGSPVKLFEGPLPGWTVIYDRDAGFTVSPGYRTVFVSPFEDVADLERRLEPVTGRVEGFALASIAAKDSSDEIRALRATLERAGASYICQPGQMQSPPLDWPHGGAAFIKMLG